MYCCILLYHGTILEMNTHLMSRPHHRRGYRTEGSKAHTGMRPGSHGSHSSAGEEACDHRGGEVGEIVQGVREAQADVFCSSSVQYRTVYVYVCMRECLCASV